MYQDLSGSGAETVSHLRDNGRITIMFTAFDGPPNIVRLYGKGEDFLGPQLQCVANDVFYGQGNVMSVVLRNTTNYSQRKTDSHLQER